ncbi:TPA: pertactin family autotransporter [Pseudomonas putida]|nr:pertactin family autotransporter [Pseudomonas putida]
MNLACDNRDFCNATANDTTINGGALEIFHTSTANRTTINNGLVEAWHMASVNDTTINGGQVLLRESSRASGSILNDGQLTVADSATTNNTMVNGGYLSVWGNATASLSRINQGGTIESVAGTRLQFTTVNHGGVMILGNQAQASDTTLNAGGVLRLKGDATLDGASLVYGQVNFADPAIDGFHTLTLNGPLNGHGRFLLNTNLATRSGDLIRVQGQTGGSHTLVVADSGQAPRNARSLQLVDGNGGDGEFILYGGTVDAGAFRYELQPLGNNWYLVGTDQLDPFNEPVEEESPIDPTESVAPVEPVHPVFPADPAEPDKPLAPAHRPQAETLSKGANAAVAGHAASATLIGAQMTATTGHFGDLRSGNGGGLWTRAYGAEQRLDTGVSRAFQQQVQGMEIGADKALPFVDGTLYVGALAGQGRGKQDFGEASTGTLDSITLGGYASYLERSGLYVDCALKYTHLDNDINITSNLGHKVEARYKQHALSADVQMGKRIDLGQGWFADPQVGVQIAQVGAGNYTASNGLSVEQEAMTSVQSRIGGMLGRDLQLDNGVKVKPYAKATWITEHAGHSRVKVSGATLDSRLPGSRAELGGGFMVATSRQHSLYVEGEYTKGSDIEQPWAVTVGYRYDW